MNKLLLSLGTEIKSGRRFFCTALMWSCVTNYIPKYNPYIFSVTRCVGGTNFHNTPRNEDLLKAEAIKWIMKKSTIYYKSYTCSVINVFQGNDSTRLGSIWFSRMWHEYINDPEVKAYKVNQRPHLRSGIPP